jgi:hypothetical protein
MSTYLFGLFLKHHGGTLISLDLSPTNVALAGEMTAGLSVDVIQTDSRDWLRAYQGAPIDWLYLDSVDVGTEGYAEVALAETRLASPRLAEDAVVLVDDSPRRGGKGPRAVPWLVERGLKVVGEGGHVHHPTGEPFVDWPRPRALPRLVILPGSGSPGTAEAEQGRG